MSSMDTRSLDNDDDADDDDDDDDDAAEEGFEMRSSTSTPTTAGTSSSIRDEGLRAAEAAERDSVDGGLAMRSSTSTPTIEGASSSMRIGEEETEKQKSKTKAQFEYRERCIFMRCWNVFEVKGGKNWKEFWVVFGCRFFFYRNSLFVSFCYLLGVYWIFFSSII